MLLLSYIKGEQRMNIEEVINRLSEQDSSMWHEDT